MSLPPATPADPLARRARLAVALLFLTNGALFANLLPRYPQIKEHLGVSNGQFGLAVSAFPLGAIIAGLGAGVLIRRFGSARIAVAGTILTSAGILLAGIAPTWPLFAAALLLAGSFDAITDVAQNSHGLRVQRLYGRSIINSFHAVWSMGAVLGGLMGGAAAGLGVPLPIHLAVSAVLFCSLSLGCYRLLLPGPEPKEVAAAASASEKSAKPGLARAGVLIALVAIAASGAIIEDSGNSWSAIYLSESLDAGEVIAALGFVALVGAQFIGRLAGDRLVDRFGQRAVARAGGLLIALGFGSALAFPSVPLTILGFAAAGFGSATLVPAAMDAADRIPGLAAGTGLTIVSWLMRLGFLLAPPLVGLVADATTLRVGLLIVPLAGIVVVALAGVLSGVKQSQGPHTPNESA